MPLYVVSFSADPLAVSKLSLHRMLIECDTKERAREVGEEWLSSGQMDSLLNVQDNSLEVAEFSNFLMFGGDIYPRSDSSDAVERRLPSAKQAWGGGAPSRKIP